MRRRLIENRGGVIPDIEIENIFFPEGQLHTKPTWDSGYIYISSFKLIIGAIQNGAYTNSIQEERLYTVDYYESSTSIITTDMFRDVIEIDIDPYQPIDLIDNLTITLGSIIKDDNTEIKRQITSIDSRSDYGIGGIPLGNGNNPIAFIVLNESNQPILQFDFGIM